MRRVAFFALLAAVFPAGAAAPSGEAPLGYTVTPRLADGAMKALEVEVRFTGDADGETALLLPDQWAGSSELWRNIGKLSATGASVVAGEGPSRRLLRHAPGAPITLRYAVTTSQRSNPGFNYEKAKPLIQPDWFFFHGEGVFAYPLERETAPASFRWGPLPQGWRTASDLDHLARSPGTLKDIVESVAIGGAQLTVTARDVDGAPLRLAMLGKWDFPPAQMADAVQRIFAAENDYWGDEAGPFLVAMAPLGTVDGLSYTGTGRGDGFSVASTTGFPLADAAQFLAHEINHRWMPAALGEMPRDNEGTDYWLSEGFNDYLTARILLRSGLWDLDRYAAHKNEVLLRYGSSPARTASAEEVARNFWTDGHMQQVSYDRGHLLALLIDDRLRERNGGLRGLDDVLLAQKKAVEAGSNGLATALFLETLRDFGGIDAAADIARVTGAGEPVLLPENLLGECARITTASRREFHRGYDAEATAQAGGVIAGVRPDGPAYAAGMRDGMRLVKREFGKLGDSSVEIGYRVEADGGERVIRYYPEGERDLTVQRMELVAGDAAHRARCLRLGGG